MANWFAAIEHRTRLLWPDEVHPQPSGARLYARMIAAAVRAARMAGAAGSAPGWDCHRPRTTSHRSADRPLHPRPATAVPVPAPQGP